jgi:hypothetical protein
VIATLTLVIAINFQQEKEEAKALLREIYSTQAVHAEMGLNQSIDDDDDDEDNDDEGRVESPPHSPA